MSKKIDDRDRCVLFSPPFAPCESTFFSVTGGEHSPSEPGLPGEEAKFRIADRKALSIDFMAILKVLSNDEPLAEKHCDHALTGNWKDHRNCHVKPDLVLIYRKPDDAVLQLVRLVSHSELGL